MKKLLLFVIFIFAVSQNNAQTEGISYQAVIINPNGIELPGVDSEGNILPNAKISVRFTILDATNSEEYQEVQNTETDLYGRINLIIGNQNRENFALINWDGAPKDLKVEIDFKGSGSNFVDMSRETLTFVPFSYHRDILARGTLIVDDTTDLNGELKVQGPTNLNSTLNVNNNNATNLSGQLNVEGATNLKSNFKVEGITTFNDSVSVNAESNFAGNMKVTADAVFEGKMEFKSEEPANFNSMVIKDSINVEGPSNLSGQVRINASSKTTTSKNKSAVIASKNVFSDYPMIVEGSEQGIAIKVNGSRSQENNFISFWDDEEGGKMWGRIEGLTLEEQRRDPEFLLEHGTKITNIAIETANVVISVLEWGQGGLNLAAALTSSTACVGVGACVTLPIPSWIGSKVVEVILRIANIVSIGGSLAVAIVDEASFTHFKRSQIGVSYQSGAADYAEWLPKKNSSDIFVAGELVGIKNGLVTKNTWDAEKIMIVSTRPIILGNMPQPNDEKNSVKIAFMGQVPVSVIGKVQPGDYILPNEFGIGIAKAVHPADMTTRDFKKICGVAWNVIDKISDNINLVNVAVGINSNALSDVVAKQEDELLALQVSYNQLKAQIELSNKALSTLLPGYNDAVGHIEKTDPMEKDKKEKQKNQINYKNQLLENNPDDVIHFEMSKEQIEEAIAMAREQYQNMLNNEVQLKKLINSKRENSNKELESFNLMPIKEHPFWQRIDTDPVYKEEIILFVQSKMEKAFHTHKKYAHKFTELKIKSN